MKKMDKRGMISGVLRTVVFFIAIFAILGGVASTLKAQANTVNGSGLPLETLFGGNGVIMILFMVAVMVGLIYAAIKGATGKANL